jgi:two-component system, OmpR family, response regulator
MATRILHIDDDPVMRDIVAFSLSLDPAIELTSCGDAREALAVATSRAPDIILCDVVMPDMSGPTMLAHLRENPNTAKVPFVFITANARAKELEALKALGSVAVITKPFDPITLADTVIDHLNLVRKHEDLEQM